MNNEIFFEAILLDLKTILGHRLRRYVYNEMFAKLFIVSFSSYLQAFIKLCIPAKSFFSNSENIFHHFGTYYC